MFSVWKLTVLQETKFVVNFLVVSHDATHHNIGVPVDVFRDGMHNDIRAQKNRVLKNENVISSQVGCGAHLSQCMHHRSSDGIRCLSYLEVRAHERIVHCKNSVGGMFLDDG